MCLRLFCCIILFLFALPLSIQAEKKSVNTPISSAYTDDNTHEIIRKLGMPIDPTVDGISEFIKKTYNQPEYGKDLLPNSFDHLEQLLYNALQTKQPRAYVQALMRLFGNKLKTSEYVNSYALEHLLDQMPALMHSYFKASSPLPLDTLHTKINTMLYETFLHKFSDFKNNPDNFFDNLAQEIVNTTQAQLQKPTDISVEELRKTTLIFLEIAVGKLIWSPDEATESWKSVKQIGNHLVTIFDYDIIGDPDDLNDLFITLTERYSFFLDLTSSHLKPSFFAFVREDLAADIPLMLSMDEQEEHIESKYQRFQRSLTLAHAKLQAYQQGIVTR